MLFETTRLIIRKPIPSDRDDLHTMLHDPVVLKYNCITPPSLEVVEQFIQKTASDDKMYVLEDKQTSRVIGELHLTPDKMRYGVNSILFSYHLNTDYSGQGFMSEALRGALDYCFSVRQADLIAARVFTLNERSNQLLKHLGFTLEGTLRQAIKAYQDVVYDDNLYCMTRAEYLIKKAEK